jgi:hypothetical protein
MALLIRREQLAVMERDLAITEFERDVLARLERRVPGFFFSVPDLVLGEIVRIGVARAASHGLTRRGAVRVFVEMMITFGSAFDTDPMFPWAASALRERHPTELERAARLTDVTAAYLEEVAGPGHASTRSALQRFGALAKECLATPLAGGDLEAAVEDRARSLIPERFLYLGHEGARSVVRHHLATAATYGLEGEEAAAFSMIASLFGHGFVADPRFPWAAALAADPAPRDRMRDAVGEASVYCSNVLKSLGNE